MKEADELRPGLGTRDRRSRSVEPACADLCDEVMAALHEGDLAVARAAIERHETQSRLLAESLRATQAELRARTDELSLSQARADAARARFSALFAAMPVAVLLLTRLGELLEHNVRASALLGLRSVHHSARVLQRWVDAADFQGQVGPALAAGRHACIERVRFATEAGRAFTGELILAPLPPADGQPACLIGIVTDRSAQLAQGQALTVALDQLGTSRALLAESARLARWGGFEVDLSDGSWRASAELCSLIDWPGPTPLQPDAFLALGNEPQALALRDALEQALAAGSAFDLPFDLRTPGGRLLNTVVRGRRVQPPGGRGHLIGLVQDVSAQRHLLAARESAEAANRAKSRFLMRMSHELRTPLNAVIGFTQLMGLEAARGDLTVKPRRLEMMDAAARHLLEVINEVLDVSRIESDTLALAIEPVPVAPLLDECLTLAQGLADTAGVALEGAAGAEAADVRVLADRLRLKEVLINLLSNAVKYNRPQGRVRLHVEGDAHQVLIAVSDTGRGLDEAALEGLFQPFNRLGAEVTAIEGSGIGLFVSKRFVEAMQGSLGVSSRLGAGSTFTVVLPRG